VMEPILLLIIGLIVGFVALAIITPIYELTGSIRR
jgi:type II secretory pathway component PulF